jgi:hypothetical protein
MAEKPKHPPVYSPQRVKELVDNKAALRLRWLVGVNSRSPRKGEKLGRLSERLAKLKDHSKNRRDRD